MTFDEFMSRVTIVSGGNPDFYDKTHNALIAIWASAQARSDISDWLNYSEFRDIEIKYTSSNEATGVLNAGGVIINDAFVEANMYISNDGNVVKMSYVAALAHELSHAVTLHADDPTFTSLQGSNINNVNLWYSQLGISQVSSYNAQYDPLNQSGNYLSEGKSYTNNHIVSGSILDRGGIDPSLGVDLASLDMTVLGNSCPLLIVGSNRDNTYKGTTAEDWIYGNGGVDILDGGAGDDHLFGGSGDDKFINSEGSDEIWGGDAGNDQGKSDGVDTVDYSSNAPSQSIHINFDGTSSKPVITVQDGLGGTDTLHSIEKIIGTTGEDTFSFKGTIPNGYNLLIDSGGGAHDIIDLQQSVDEAGLNH